MLLAVNSLSHLLVDGLCAATLFGRMTAPRSWLFLLYNTLAFSTQAVAGLAADRLRRHPESEAGAIMLVLLGWLLPLPSFARVLLIGLGNSVFHVAGGCMTLERSEGKAGPLGVFVAPGAVGLTLGTLWPRLGAVFALLAVLCAAAELALSRRLPAPAAVPKEAAPSKGALIPLLLTLAVAVRAVGGSAVSFPWKTGTVAALLTMAVVFAGKTAGGFVCDRLGARRSALLSVPAAALLIAFCTAWMLPSLLGQFALNLTMPVTLWLLYREMPGEPGLAFGLAASALWPGTLAGRLMTLTGPVLWLCVILSFLFSLWAILYSARSLTRAHQTS